MELMAQLRERGLRPDVGAYCAAISACDKGGQPARAVALLGEMEERGIGPHESTFNAAMQALLSADQLDAAFALLARVQASPGVAERSYTTHLLLGPGDALVTSAGTYPTLNYFVAGRGGTSGR